MKLNYQYAHHSHEESEDQPIDDLEQALVSFDQFDWKGEASKANELQKCSPTLTLVIKESEEYIWVSAYDDGNNLMFVSECFFPGIVSKWFGLSQKHGIVNLSGSELSQQKARRAIEHFIKKEHDELRAMYV